MGISLKKNLHYFDKEELFREISHVNQWYDTCEVLHGLTVDYRIKSIQSARLKYNRYYPDHQMRKVFDDLLGFRSLCDNYETLLNLEDLEGIRIADMSNGKASDDGYRGVHVYYQKSGLCYPIEIQYNTYYDSQLNYWLHKYLYKKNYSAEVGSAMRKEYEQGGFSCEDEFKEVLNHVLSNR